MNVLFRFTVASAHGAQSLGTSTVSLLGTTANGNPSRNTVTAGATITSLPPDGIEPLSNVAGGVAVLMRVKVAGSQKGGAGIGVPNGISQLS
jgi:hypothetical protein